MRRTVAATFLVVSIFVGNPVASPVEASNVWLCPKYTAQIKKAFPRKDWRTMDRIMWRESKCQTRAIGWNYHKGKSHRDCKLSHARTYRKCPAVKSYDVGLFQINSSWKTVTARICRSQYGKMLVLQKSSCNFKVAAYLYKNGGLKHWEGTSGK